MKRARGVLVFVLVIVLLLSIPGATVFAQETVNDLGPVSSKDVIYQIITDRFYDGDSTNNIPEKQRLLYKNKQLKSVYIEKLEEEIQVILIQNQEPPYGWGYIAHSITESKALDKFMEVTRKDKNESS